MTQSDRPGEFPDQPNAGHFWSRLHQIWTLLARADVRAAHADNPNRYVDEYLYSPNAASLPLQANVDNPVLIQALIAYSQSSVAVLTIGTQRTIPIPQGLTVISAIGMVLKSTDTVVLTPAVAGNLFVELMGIQLPTITV